MIDLNCDMGELPELLADGTQEALLALVTSANIACGAHAGDERLMAATIEAALRHGVRLGAHPGYPDRPHFGRVALDLTPEAIADTVEQQVTTLAEVARRHGAKLSHGKPHGALYNEAAKNAAIAEAIATGFARVLPGVPLMGLAGSPTLAVYEARGFPVLAEAFADRRYEPDGSLRARTFADALIHDPAEAAAQALRLASQRDVVAVTGERIRLHAQTLCIHGDTAGAVEIANAVRAALDRSV